MSFEINLIKNEVIPFRKRRTFFFGMIIYLAICGISFAILSHSSTLKFIKMIDYEWDTMSLEATYRRFHPAEKDIFNYARDLRSRMAISAERLEAVDNILSKYINLAYLLEGFSTKLPADGHIDNFSF